MGFSPADGSSFDFFSFRAIAFFPTLLRLFSSQLHQIVLHGHSRSIPHRYRELLPSAGERGNVWWHMRPFCRRSLGLSLALGRPYHRSTLNWPFYIQ